MPQLPQQPRYILCQFVPTPNGKTDKIPLNPHTLKAHNPFDKSIHMTYETAKELSVLYNTGIGFVFLTEDKYFFLDFDNCYDETTNTWSKLVLDSILILGGAYTEVSNSQRGIHIIGRYEGDRPIHKTRRSDLGLELYTGDRFVALAEIHPNGDAETIHTHTLLDYIIRLDLFNTAHDTSDPHWTTEPDPSCNPPQDDNELIDFMLNRSPTGPEIFGSIVHIRDLWTNNIDVLEKHFPTKTIGKQYDSSAADMALAIRLHYFTGGDCERILRLMCLSELKRDKWEREDYLPRTILNARGVKFHAYDLPRSQTNNNQPVTQNQQDLNNNRFIDTLRMHELFKDCVYILKEHRVLMPNGTLLKPEQFRAKFGGFAWPMDEQSTKTTKNAWDAFNESMAYKKTQVYKSCFNPFRDFGDLIPDGNLTTVNIYYPEITPRVFKPVERFLNHIRLMLPDPNDQLILLSFMAAIVQYKGIKFTWCVVIQGAPGNGKSFLCDVLTFCLGHKFVHTAKAAEFTGRFNGWLQNKLLITVADIKQNNSETLEILKPMITDKRQEIENKGIDKTTETVYCNFILTTNHKDGIRKSREDRRFCTLLTAQQEASDLERDGMGGGYFPELFDWFNNQDGAAAINEFLSTFQIPDYYNPATQCIRAPITSTTEEAINQSLHPFAILIQEWIEEGYQGLRNCWVSSVIIHKLFQTNNQKYNPKHLSTILNSIGYYKHPGLIKGRTNRKTSIDHVQPRLYITKNHPSYNLDNPEEITKSYEEDNNC